MKNEVNNTTGEIDFVSYLLSGSASGAGVIASINFRAKAVGTSSVRFRFDIADNRETKVLNSRGIIPAVYKNCNTAVVAHIENERFIGVRAYPNPIIVATGDKVNITWEATKGKIDVKIFNIAGELIREEDDIIPEMIDTTRAGWVWDITNDAGRRVASGIYIYLLTNEYGDKATGKIAVIK